MYEIVYRIAPLLIIVLVALNTIPSTTVLNIYSSKTVHYMEQTTPTVSSTENEFTVVETYRYVFPLVFLEPKWGADDFWTGVIIVSVNETVNVWIDANYNSKVDEGDIHFIIHPGEVLRVGRGRLMPTDIQWTKNPLIIFTDKPVDIYAWIYDNDFGIYDETNAAYSAPIPATLLLGVSVSKLYITPWEEDANVYINGKYQGIVRYGEVLTIEYDQPTNVIVSSDKPIVAVSLSMDLESKSRLYAFSLMPPLSGEYLIPPAVGSIARELGAINVDEYYVVIGADGGILERAPLLSQPKILTLNNAAVFVFRSFHHVDPWARAPRYVVSAEGLSPVSPSLCYWQFPAYNAHGEYTQIVVYAKGETHIYFDWGIDGTLDDKITVSNEIYTLSSKDYPSASFAVHVEGLMTCSAIYIGAWNFHLDTARERRSTIPILSKVITTTTTPPTTATTHVEMPLQLYVNASTAFSYVLIPYSSDMWLVAIRGDGPMIGRIAEKYFNKIVEGPTMWNYTSGDWYVVGVKYLTTVEGYPQYRLYQLFSVARRGDLVVAAIKYTNVGEEVTLTQWWSHIHKGIDALRILPVPPGYRVESNWEREHWSTMEAFLKESKLYIGGQYYGTLREQRLWRSLPPGDLKLVRGSSLVVVKPLNELSTTRQIQLVVSNYGLVTEGVGHVRLDFQHAEVTLGSGGEAQYVYIITLGREPTQRDIDEATRILPKLLETPQQTAAIVGEEYQRVYSYIIQLKEFYEWEINAFRDLIVDVLKASRADQKIIEAVDKYIRGEYSVDVASRITADILRKTIKENVEKYLKEILGESVDIAFEKLDYALVANKIATEINSIIGLGVNEAGLRYVASAYVVSLIESSDLRNLLPFHEAVKGLEIENYSRIVIVYDNAKLSEAIKVLVDSVDRQGPGEEEALIKLINLLSENLGEELHEYPLWGAPISWFKKIVDDISAGIAITKILKISYIISSTATEKVVPPYKWADILLSNILEAKEEELQVGAVASIILVAHRNLYMRFSYLYSYMFVGLFSPSTSLAEAEKQSLIVNRINVIDLPTLKLLLDNKMTFCYVGATYKSEFLDYGYYVTWTYDTDTFLRNLGYLLQHRAKLVCGYGIHREVTVNLGKEPSITDLKPSVKLTLKGILLGVNARIQNHYPVPINITVIAYPPTIDALKKIQYVLQQPVYMATTKIDPNSTREVFIPVVVLVYTKVLALPFASLLSLGFDIVMNRAIVARTSLLGSFISLFESKHKLYLSVIDEEGRTVGYKDRDVVVEILGADFIDLGNGTQIAYLPPEVSSFTIVVDARDAVYDLEEYNLTVVSFNESGSGLAVLSASVERGEQQRVAVSWRGDRISVEPLNIRDYRVVHSENAEITTTNRSTTGSAIQMPIRLLATTMVILAVATTLLLAIIALKTRKRRQ